MLPFLIMQLWKFGSTYLGTVLSGETRADGCGCQRGKKDNAVSIKIDGPARTSTGSHSVLLQRQLCRNAFQTERTIDIILLNFGCTHMVPLAALAATATVQVEQLNSWYIPSRYILWF